MSVDSSGVEGNDWSNDPAVSADGRYVAFQSGASNLVPGDTNGTSDLFVHDRRSGTTIRVSVDSSGLESNSYSDQPSISADGRFVAFLSDASNLVSGDTNGREDIFVHDLQGGTTSRVSVDSSGAEGNSESELPSISADGRYVAFTSRASNLVSGDTNGAVDIFVHDRQSGTTSRVSVDSSGAQANGFSLGNSISADGRYVAFASDASNLVPGDTNGREDVFVHDRQSGSTTLVSVDSSGTQGNSDSFGAGISADGGFVAFTSLATNLVSGDTRDRQDGFVHDSASGDTTRVTVDSSGGEANDLSVLSTISVGGRYVTFLSQASNLVAGDTNGDKDIFVHDRASGLTTRASVDSSGAQGNAGSYGASNSGSGRYVAFESIASNLVQGDTNGEHDIFVRGCGLVGTPHCAANPNSTGAAAQISASCSASSAAASLTLDAVLVPDQFGQFVHGRNTSQTVFGNGFLCTSDDVVRGAVIHALGGLVTYTYDNSDVKHSVAAHVGSTQNFQYWFRDPVGGGALFNTSNAISIPILP